MDSPPSNTDYNKDHIRVLYDYYRVGGPPKVAVSQELGKNSPCNQRITCSLIPCQPLVRGGWAAILCCMALRTPTKG